MRKILISIFFLYLSQESLYIPLVDLELNMENRLALNSRDLLGYAAQVLELKIHVMMPGSFLKIFGQDTIYYLYYIKLSKFYNL